MKRKSRKDSKKRVKMSGSMRSLRKGVQRLLSSGKYLIRGDRDGRIDLGEAGGTWATNDIDNALIYGDQISVVTKPKKILQSEIDDAFANYVDPNYGKGYSFDDATPAEWIKLRDRLLKDGYDALEITAPVNGNVQDFWILEQPKLLSVEEALLELEEEEG
jgi:hypothetical protein